MPVVLIALLLCACSSPSRAPIRGEAVNSYGNAAEQPLVELNSPEGERLLFGSGARSDYLPLSLHFETQQNLAYCGAASMAMVLNALEIPAPIVPEYKRYRLFTQNNVFNADTDRIVSAKTVARQGMTLEELGKLMKAHSLDTQVIFGNTGTMEQFRSLAVQNLKQAGNFVLVNYLRRAIGQDSGGHISPLAAYHEDSDQFLILDVSRYKYPPVWVTTERLWRAMNTVDAASGRTRGFILISRPPKLDAE